MRLEDCLVFDLIIDAAAVIFFIVVAPAVAVVVVVVTVGFILKVLVLASLVIITYEYTYIFF